MLDLHLHSLEKIQLLLSIRFDSYMSDKTVTYYLVVKAIQATGKIIFCYNYYCYFFDRTNWQRKKKLPGTT